MDFTRFITLHLIYADSARFDSKLIAYRQVSVAAWTDRLNSTKFLSHYQKIKYEIQVDPKHRQMFAGHTPKARKFAYQ